MSAVQSACIAHRNGDSNGYHDEVVDVLENGIDANGDDLNTENGLKTTSSSEEDIASCSSNNDESDEIIHIKTR